MDSEVLIHCAKCRKFTKTFNLEKATTRNNRPMLKGQCDVCKTRKSTFVKMNKNNQEDALFESDSNGSLSSG